MSDERVLSALQQQLEHWRAAIGAGADRVGWKIGFNIPAVREQIGLAEPVIGHLTSATVVKPGGTHHAREPTRLVVEPEIAVEVGSDDRVASLAPALELADFDRELSELDDVLAENIFHRGVVFGAPQPVPGPRPLSVTVAVNDEERASAEAEDTLTEMTELTARLLRELGEELLPGDRIITGTITPPVPVAPGDHIVADFGSLGSLEVRVA